MSRRKLRAVIIQMLYSDEFHPHDSSKSKDMFLKDLKPLDKSFVLKRIKGLKASQEKLDQVISQHAKNWKKERLSLVDLNIMRLGVFEILFCEDVPGKSALNECLELAKQFGGPDSSRFINGILDKVLKARTENFDNK